MSEGDFSTAALLTNSKPYCPFQGMDEDATKAGKETPKKKALSKCQVKCKENPNCLNSVGAELWAAKGVHSIAL